MPLRIDPFAPEDKPALSRFQPKRPGGDNRPSLAELEQRPENGKFVSREPALIDPPARNYYRTGRDTQFNTKVTREVKQRFDEIARETRRPLGEILERALAALEEKMAREGEGS